MSNVIVLNEAVARMLARELGVSIEFVDACQGLDITPAQGKLLLRWFLRSSLSVRLVVIKGTLRDVKAARPPRAKRLPLPPVFVPPAPSPDPLGPTATRSAAPPPPAEDLGPEPVLARAQMYASWNAAKKRADVDGAVTLTPASYAGMLLEDAAGDIDLALSKLPISAGPFWGTVRSQLESLAGEETST